MAVNRVVAVASNKYQKKLNPNDPYDRGASSENIYFIRGSIIARVTSYFICLDLAALLMLKEQ